MAVLLFRLRSVPDDEADEIRELLTANGMDWYETPAGRWGISMPAIWLKDEARLEQARRLLDAYQQERTRRIRDEYQRARSEGRADTVWSRMRQRPLQFVLYLGVILLVLYLSLKPFVAP